MGLEQVSPLISVTYGFRTGVTTNLHHTLNLPVSLINLIVDKSISLLSWLLRVVWPYNNKSVFSTILTSAYFRNIRVTELTRFSLWRTYKLQWNRKWYVSSGAQLQSHLSNGVSAKLWRFYDILEHLNLLWVEINI